MRMVYNHNQSLKPETATFNKNISGSHKERGLKKTIFFTGKKSFSGTPPVNLNYFLGKRAINSRTPFH
jgi:hypothetical protein